MLYFFYQLVHLTSSFLNVSHLIGTVIVYIKFNLMSILKSNFFLLLVA
nr:MAG TPA: hypothetical protein [Caudoviricetes sp.]